jgi:polysaccharide pyruvyl transferase CsaB
MSDKILIIGWYGYDNLGDDLLLNVIVDFFDRDKNEIYYTAPKKVIDNGINIKLSTKKELMKLICKLYQFNSIVLGGGTYLRDLGNKKNLKIKLIILSVAILLRKKIILFGSGIGPFSYNKNSFLLRFVFKNITTPLLRDKNSCEIYRKITGKDSILTPDPVMLLSQNKNINNYADNGKKGKKKVIAFSLREWHDHNAIINNSNFYNKFIDTIFHFIKDKSSEYDFQFLIFQNNTVDKMADDLKVYEDILLKSNDLSLKCIHLNTNIKELCNVYNNFDILIGMRLHSLILGSIFDKKMIAISYEPKVNSFMNELNIEEFSINFEDLTLENLYFQYNNLIKQDYSQGKKDMLLKISEYNKLLN